MRMVSNKSSALLSSYMSTNYSNNLSQNSSRSRRKTKSRKKSRRESDDHNSDSDDKSSKSSDESLQSNNRSNDRSNRFVKKSIKSNLSESESEDDSDSNLSASDNNEKCEFSIVKEDNDSTAGTLKLRIATRRTNSVPNKKPENSHPVPKRQLSVIEAVSGVVHDQNDDGADHGLDCQCWLHAGKGKRQPIPMKINRKHRHRRKRNDSSYDSSRSQSRSRSRSDSRSGQSYSGCSSRSCSTGSSRSSYSSRSSSSCGSFSCSSSGSSSGSSSSSSVSGDSDSSDSDIDCKRKADHSLNYKNSKQSKHSSMSESYVNRSEDSSNGLRINCNQQNLMPSTPLSQPSSVSCESSCYSPAISINSPMNSMYAHKKRDPAEERQRLRSYRIPHLQNRDRAVSSGSNSANTQSNKTPMTATVAVQVQTDTEDMASMNKSKTQSNCKSKSVGTDTVDANNGKKQMKNKNKKSKKEKSDKNVKNHDNKRSKSQNKTKKSKTKKSQSRTTETALGSNYKSDSATAPLAVETNSKHGFSDSLYSDVNRVINQISLNENCSVINNNEKITHFLQSVPHLNDTNHPNSSLESLHHEKASPDSGIQSQGESPHRHHSISDTEVHGMSTSTSRSAANSQKNSRTVNTRKKQKTKQSSKTKSDKNSKKSLINSSALQTNDAKSDNQTDFQVNPVKSVDHLIPGVNLVPQNPPAMTSNPSNLAQLTEIFLNNSNPSEATMGANFDLRVQLNLMPTIMGRNLMPYPRCHPASGHLPFMNPPKREDDFELLFRSIKEQISQFPNNENEELDFDQFNVSNSTNWRQSHHNDLHFSQMSYQSTADSSAPTSRQRKRITESGSNRKKNNRLQNKTESSDQKDISPTERSTTGSGDRKSRSKSKKTCSTNKSKADKSMADKQTISDDLKVQMNADLLATSSRHALPSVEAENRIHSEKTPKVSNDNKVLREKSDKMSEPMELKIDIPTHNPVNKTSLSSSSRKHHKRKRKKHKNHSKHKESPVEVNPEFVSLMENLSKNFKLLKVSKRVTTGALETKSRQPMPTIFQFINFLKNIKNAKKHHLEHSIAVSSHCTDSPKVTATKKSNKKKVTNSMNQTEQTLTEKKKIEKKSEVTSASVSSANGSTGANEQRLPLKKRHHRHIETKQNSVSAVNTSQSSNSSTIASNHFHSSPNHSTHSSDIKTNFNSNVDNHSNGSTGDIVESKKRLSSSHSNNSSTASPGVQSKTKRSTSYVSPKTSALSETESVSKVIPNSVSNGSKSEPSVVKKSSVKSNKSETNANKAKKSANKSSLESQQVVLSSAEKQNGILSDENQMAIWDRTGSPVQALAAPHNSKATASDRPARLSPSARPISCDSVKAQNSIDETIEQCIRKYSLHLSDTGSDSELDKEVTKKRKVYPKSDPKSEEKSTKLESNSVFSLLSESVVSGVCDTLGVTLLTSTLSSCEQSIDTMRSRSSQNKTAKNAVRTHGNRKDAKVNKTTKRDLKSGQTTAKSKAQTQQSSSNANAINATISGTDANRRPNRKRVNKTGFPAQRKRVRTESSVQHKQQNSVKPMATTVNGKRPHSATVETTQSVTQKKDNSSNDINRKSSQGLNRCRSSERTDSSKSAGNSHKKSVKTRTSSDAQSSDKSLVIPKTKKLFTALKPTPKSDRLSMDKPLSIKGKGIRGERRLSKASIDSISSSDASHSEQSLVSEAPVYWVTEPTNRSAIDSYKNVMKIKSFQRSIPYKKVAYLKFGKYSEDSKFERTLNPVESDDKLSDSQCSQMSATEDSSSALKEESKVSQKLIQMPELEFDSLEEYRLPYDIYFQLIKNKNKSDHTAYTRIKQNCFSNVTPVSKYQAQSCNCDRPMDGMSKGCGVHCLNRLSYLECTSETCPVGDICDNQRMQRHNWSPGLQRFMTIERGWGIRTTESIKSGDFILEYIGEVVSEKEFKTRMAERYQNDQHHYCLNLDSGMVIDGYRKANEGRFVNHSCEPNCEMQKWSVNGLYRVGLFALRDILPNEELSYDYNFDNFNLETQQVCRCGSVKCRGYIGVRSQKLSNSLLLKDRTDKNDTNVKEVSANKVKEDNHRNRRKDVNQTKSGTSLKNKTQSLRKPSLSAIMKPLSHQSSCFILKHRCFLLRNYEKLRRIRNNESERKLTAAYSSEDFVKGKDSKSENSKDLINTLMTLNSRSVRTRGLAKAESNEELTRTAKLIPIFSDVCQSIINKQIGLTAKIETTGVKCVSDAKPCVISISRRKSTDKQTNRIDLSEFQSQIRNGFFKSPQTFEDSFMKVLSCPPNCETNCTDNTSSADFEFSAQMREEFQKLMAEKKPFIEDIMSSDNGSNCGDQTNDSVSTPKDIKKSESSDSLSNISMNSIPQSNPLLFTNTLTSISNDENNDQNQLKGVKQDEEVIQCICGILKEEGEMIQCDKCEIWQHCDCVGVKDTKSDEPYYCEVCEPRSVPTEIPLPKSQVEDSTAPEGTQNMDFYRTLCHNNLRVKLGDCVYYCPHKNDKQSPRKRPKEESNGVDCKSNYIILRVTHLVVDIESGQKYVWGTHFLRPSETYHEPSRKFFEKEVLRSPIADRVPIEDVKGLCCVLDPSTYCKGRPKGFDEEDVYICEMRTDRHAKSFNKISKANHFQINTHNYAFNWFQKKLTIKRNYTPHDVPDSYVKSKPKSKSELNSKPIIVEKDLKMKKILELNEKLLKRALKLKENQLNSSDTSTSDCGKQSLKR